MSKRATNVKRSPALFFFFLHGVQLLASVQRELQADQLVLPLACSECSPPLQGLVRKEGDRVGVIAGDEHEQPPAPRSTSSRTSSTPSAEISPDVKLREPKLDAVHRH